MARALVDTGVLIGVADSDDQHHDAARRIVDGIDEGSLPTGIVTNYVVLETLNWIQKRQRHDKAVELYGKLTESAGFEVHHAPVTDFDRAVDLFERHEELAFGDATIAAYMLREEVDYYYGFDDDIEAAGDLTMLDTAANPYG